MGRTNRWQCLGASSSETCKKRIVSHQSEEATRNHQIPPGFLGMVDFVILLTWQPHSQVDPLGLCNTVLGYTAFLFRETPCSGCWSHKHLDCVNSVISCFCYQYVNHGTCMPKSLASLLREVKYAYRAEYSAQHSRLGITNNNHHKKIQARNPTPSCIRKPRRDKWCRSP